MANAPLAKLVLGDLVPERIRELELEHHVEMIANDSRQIAHYQASLLRLQSESAALNLRAMGHLAGQQELTNSYLQDITGGINRLNNTLQDGFDDVNANLQEGFNAVTGVLQEGFQVLADRLLQQHESLLYIAKITRQPYDNQVQNLWEKANNCLDNGRRSTGRDRTTWYNQAVVHIKSILDNPAGREDYIAWFEMGWLNWKHLQELQAAEEAFDNARCFSKPTGSPYFHKSIRHLAYTQYLQGKFGEAHETIKEALQINSDHNTMYDAARYAAKIGNQQLALALLEKCIRLRPETIVVMFSEEDFQE